MKNAMNSICRIGLFLFCVMCGICMTVHAQNVSNVSATQVGKTIHITYDLDKAADISVFMSTSGGISYRELRQVTGDVGKTVGPGHKTIVWDVLDEMEELIGDDIVFMVRVDANAEAKWRKKQRSENIKNMPRSTFFTVNAAYSPQPQWSCGFKVGQVKVVGWFIGAMSGFHFSGMYHPFEEDHSYALTDCKRVRLSAQAGFAVRPCKPMTMLFGVGYGYRTLTYKTTNNEWFSYPKYTSHGVDVSFGFLFDIKSVAFSAEAVSTNFKTIEARVGVGFCLSNKKHEKQTIKVLR